MLAGAELLIVAAAAGACACWCLRTAEAGAGRVHGAGTEEEVSTQVGKPAKRNRARKGRMDAGVQGPVHYTGKRYVHRSQGFSRGDEVTHHPTTKTHFE